MTDVTLKIDDKQVTVPGGTSILAAALKAGITIPHYCWHPGLSAVGNCRMCLVQVEKMPKPVASCVQPVSEGMKVATCTEEIVKIRKSVMEFLLINHPLDCPTCDQAGECRLQDYYMSYDEVPSRFAEEKVHKEKMIDLGANVMLDCERCIACTRCIRVCQEVAGTDELTLANRGDRTVITVFPGKKLSNPYAGNTIDVCPVGALTNKDFRFKKRVWFLSRTPSICPGCSRGCNIEIHHEEGKVYRILPRYNPEVNKYWICDEGRYGYKFINENRILRPRILERNISRLVGHEEALDRLAEMIEQLPPDEIGVVAHAQETGETLKAFYDFARNVLKTRFLYTSRREVENPYHDDILITADKNPNQAFVDKLGFKPLSELKTLKGLLVLNGLNEADLKITIEKRVPILCVWAANEGPVTHSAMVVLPIPTYAEQEGHFTNVQGLTQKITKAYSPRGEVLLVTETLAELTERLQSHARVDTQNSYSLSHHL
ncbi:MAG: (2Fe-2S)-binding protein [Deltaproteobacteria bacterium]|nr:(2Fe-2S)-binding protein [Deltaproteobacteria bacterium]